MKILEIQSQDSRSLIGDKGCRRCASQTTSFPSVSVVDDSFKLISAAPIKPATPTDQLYNVRKSQVCKNAECLLHDLSCILIVQ